MSLCLGAATAGASAVLAIRTGSIALAGLALESGIDSAASGVLVWRFRAEIGDEARAEHIERRAHAVIGLALIGAALYLVARSIPSLVAGHAVHDSGAAVALAGVAVLVFPWLALLKRRIAVALPSLALRADAVLTAVGAVLAAVTLLGVALSRYTDVSLADPVAGLVASALLIREAVVALRG